ncbi:MAG TPA: pectinesterase family protein [Kofleriaceae bacterium]|nr:pectinesterase family protein [Kofleriaceae bacterium]
MSWLVPVGLGVLTVLGCSSQEAEEANEAEDGLPSLGVPFDPNLPSAPAIPAACPGATLDAGHALRATGDPRTDGLPIYDPAALDTAAIQARIDACGAGLAAGQKGSVRLRVSASDPTRVAFVSGPLFLRAGVALWIDRGVTLFAAQDPRLYDAKGPGSCGTDANNTSSGCLSLINANGASATALLDGAGVMGQGVIDGLGGEPMIGGFNGNPVGTWWDVAQHALVASVSHSNPRLVDVTLANHFILAGVTLHNSPKFHVGLESDNYLVWNVTVQTPSRAVNSVGRRLNARYARNTDGIDPSDSWNGVIAYSRISVGDDQIAIKCGKYHMNTVANAGQPSCRNLVVAHTSFGTGHGMSIGSETNGGPGDDSHPRIGAEGVRDPATQRMLAWGVHVYDLTIDGSMGTGSAPDVDINGIRIKSDVSRGGLVKDVLYENVCLRNLPNPIILNPHYDPTKVGTLFPTYQNIILRNIHAVPSTQGSAPPASPIVTLLGLDQAHRTAATLDNVVVDGLDTAHNVVAQYADLTLGPAPVNFTPTDTVSPSGTPSTVTVTRPPSFPRLPFPCDFPVQFPDFGNQPSPDNNASLRGLAIDADGAGVGLSPAFSSMVTSYTATLPFQTERVSLSPTISAARSRTLTVTQDGGAPVSVASGSSVPLAVPVPGETSRITVSVTAEDATTTASYTVLLTRVRPATDAALSALTDSAAALAFDPTGAQTAYSYAVPAALATGYTVTPTSRDPHASIRVNGTPVASGAPVPIDLGAGAATVTIAVLAEDGLTSITYTLEITVTHTTVPVTGIALSASSLRLDTSVATAATLVATLSPAGATDRGVLWTSSDPSVASVDGTGAVRATSVGQAVITATSHDGGLQASCTVRVFALAFSDDFEAGSGQWDLLPIPGPNGAFSIATDGTHVLKYTAATVGGVLALVKDAAWTGVTSGNYYVEARIKPQSNSTTGNKQLYLIARYQDPTNWYAAGLNVQSSTASTQVEIAKMSAGSLSRPAQMKRPISLDTWYTVRFELSGASLSVYLDGELIRTVTDPAFTAGKIGLFTANKSFEIDDVRVGDPIDRPLQLTINPGTDWAATAGDAPRVVTVTAQKPDYTSGGFVPDTFTVSSSDPTVVSVQVTDNTVALAPLKAGTATITFTSGSDASLTRSFVATISPSFIQSTTVYALAGRTTPAAGDPAAYGDARLTITFDSPPVLGTAGSIRIFRKSDDALVDIIKPGAETDAIGFPGQDQLRVVNVEGLVTAAGSTVTIVPHHGKLAPGAEYYVAIASGVVAGTSLAGTPFDGIGKLGNWSFTTRPPPAASLTSLVVDDDGPADFRTVQAALDHVMKNAGRDTPVTITVHNGVYPELLFLRNKNNVQIVGESRDGVVIQYRNYETLNSGSGASQAVGPGTPAGGRSVFLVEAADLVTLDTLTLRNTMLRSTSASSQAETLYFNSDAGRLIARNASFLSEQDTVQLKGYAWFFQSLVAGNVDFIWGGARAALFESCEIRSVGDTTSTTSGGYVVQARSVSAADKGFVFLNSRLTHGPGPGPAAGDVPTGASAATYLARSPGGTASFDNVAFVSCQMDAHVIPAGWAYNLNGQPIPNPSVASADAGWREFGTTDLAGAPVSLAARAGGHVLTDSEVAAGFASRAQIFAAFGGGAGWNPQP